MKSLRRVAVLGLVWGVALTVPASTEARDQGRQGSRGYSNNRYDRNGGRGHGYSSRSHGYGHSYAYGRSYGHGYGYGRSYGYAPRYHRRPYYGYAYSYDPYYYDAYGYYAPPAYYARPYYGPRVGVVVGGPRFGLYLGW